MTFLGCIPDLPHSHDLETFQGIFFAFYKEDTEKRLILALLSLCGVCMGDAKLTGL